MSNSPRKHDVHVLRELIREWGIGSPANPVNPNSDKFALLFMRILKQLIKPIPEGVRGEISNKIYEKVYY